MLNASLFESRSHSCRMVAVVAALWLASAAPALAAQRLVRVIWDVGYGGVLYRAEPRVLPGQDAFVVPRDASEARAMNFVPAGRHPLHEGDAVRLYVVNYNPVSHVWDASSTADQIARQPSIADVLDVDRRSD